MDPLCQVMSWSDEAQRSPSRPLALYHMFRRGSSHLGSGLQEPSRFPVDTGSERERACVRSGTRGVAHAFPICVLLAAHHLTFLDAVAFVFKLLENRALERNREGP